MDVDARTRRQFLDELPKVYNRVLARALYFAADGRVAAALGGDRRQSAMDLVQEAVVRTLNGRRRWNPERVPDLERFLGETVRSIAHSYRKQGVRRGPSHDDDIKPEQRGRLGLGATPGRKPDEILTSKEACEQLESDLLLAAGDDDELLSLIQELFDGAAKPREVAEALGWGLEKTYAVFRKLRRRLTSMRSRGVAR